MTLRQVFGPGGATEAKQQTDALTNAELRAAPVVVDIGPAEVTGTFQITPSTLSTLNIPPGPLAANEVWVGEWEDVLDYAAIQVTIDTDVASAANGGVVEFSTDGVNVIRSVGTTIPANVAGYFHLAPEARFVRFRYTNGPAPQTRLRVSILYAYNAPADVVQPIGSTITDVNVATVVRSALTTRVMSGASTGVYVPVGNDGAGRALVSNQHTQPLTDAQLRASPVNSLLSDGFATIGYVAPNTWRASAEGRSFFTFADFTAGATALTMWLAIRCESGVGNPTGKIIGVTSIRVLTTADVLPIDIFETNGGPGNQTALTVQNMKRVQDGSNPVSVTTAVSSTSNTSFLASHRLQNALVRYERVIDFPPLYLYPGRWLVVGANTVLPATQRAQIVIRWVEP